MMFPQYPMPYLRMDMSWMAVAGFLWSLLAVLAIVALIWLVLTISRAEQRDRRELEDLTQTSG
jgi:uncharacterized membrane protein